jgi:hypothetical protein
MVAQKVTSRVVVLVDCMPTTAGTLGVSAVFFSGALMKRASPVRQRLLRLACLAFRC